MNLDQRVLEIAEKVLHSNGLDEGIRVISESLEANRKDYLSFLKAGRPYDARRAEEAMFLDKEVLRILQDWKEG